jgi:predicted nucleic acid-binding protein
MPASVYIESSIISYLTSRPSRDVVKAGRQAITSDWWIKSKNRYEIYISALVEEEISGGDPIAAAKRLESVANIPNIAIIAEAQLLADALTTSKAVPDNSVRDALHIAIAATQGIDYLLTWNFRHINNAETKALIARVVEADGWVCPVLCSPEELGDIDYEE